MFLGKIICLHKVFYSRKNNKSIEQIHLSNVKIINYFFSSITFFKIPYRLECSIFLKYFFINIEHKQSLHNFFMLFWVLIKYIFQLTNDNVNFVYHHRGFSNFLLPSKLPPFYCAMKEFNETSIRQCKYSIFY